MAVRTDARIDWCASCNNEVTVGLNGKRTPTGAAMCVRCAKYYDDLYDAAHNARAEA